MAGPLDGIRVLEAGLLIQGPQASLLLGDMGADVIKIELPGYGDHSRNIRVEPGDPRSAVFSACNRGKRSVSLNLGHAEGAAIFKRLVQDADVVITNFTPGTMERWGLGHDDLAAVNPRIICAQGSTFGSLGPDSARQGADLAAQAAGGLVSTTGRDGDPASPVAIFIADHIASLNMVAGILAALRHRSHTGRGQQIDVSLLGGQIWAQAAEYTYLMLTDQVAGRANSGHPMIRTIYDIFPTADGAIAIVGVRAREKDAFFVALERPDLTVDPRLQDREMTPEGPCLAARKSWRKYSGPGPRTRGAKPCAIPASATRRCGTIDRRLKTPARGRTAISPKPLTATAKAVPSSPRRSA